MKIFITGIDTGVGKTFFTGLLGKEIMKYKRVITFKFIQTGNKDNISEDIITHRKIMGIDTLKEDIEGLTCPYVFKFPSSPHLAARLENNVIDTFIVEKNIDILLKNYDYVLIEGAGGVYVPIRENFFTIEWIKKEKLPVIIVSNPRLGSINHTLLTFEALKTKNIKIIGIFYNRFFKENNEIENDTFNLFKTYFKDIIVSDNVTDFLNPILSL
ncbi:MAG TPA: dethiobiotin synthase [Spirochaetota bacterium]|nr:dethiobiotin synthase [Spirochaetota bacterium]HOM37658.1 dethiobiotin synthase [Spirochaetota bacterium]HPQ49616.1 dethiobiotin synthase [Spirochaetota bacterium]